MLSEKELAALLGQDPDRESDSQADLKLKLVLDFSLEISVRLGNAQRTLGELFHLTTGTVIELDRMLSEPVELLVNGRGFARGEVITIGEHFGIRITSIDRPEERLENLR
jgi:flagellar motor switch protein FliN/FliY